MYRTGYSLLAIWLLSVLYMLYMYPIGYSLCGGGLPAEGPGRAALTALGHRRRRRGGLGGRGMEGGNVILDR